MVKQIYIYLLILLFIIQNKINLNIQLLIFLSSHNFNFDLNILKHDLFMFLSYHFLLIFILFIPIIIKFNLFVMINVENQMKFIFSILKFSPLLSFLIQNHVIIINIIQLFYLKKNLYRYEYMPLMYKSFLNNFKFLTHLKYTLLYLFIIILILNHL